MRLTILALLIPTCAWALTFSEETVKCPLDGTVVTYKAMASATRTGQRLDLKPLGAIAAPAPLPVCPKDGLVILDEPLDAAQLKTLGTLAASASYKAAKAYGPHFQLGLMQEALGRPEHAAFSYLRASWAADGKARLNALNQSLRLYAALAADPKRDAEARFTPALLAGEIERLLGRFDAARARFEALQTSPLVEKPPFDRIIPLELKLIAAKNAEPASVP